MFKLRPYQRSHVRNLELHDGIHSALLYGVGGGKTGTALVLAQRLVARGTVDKVIAVAPQRHIRDQFRKYNGDTFRYAREEHPFLECVLTDKKPGATLRKFLEHPEGQLIAITYQTLLDRLHDLESALTRFKILLILDEGHHVHEPTADDKPTKAAILLDYFAKTKPSSLRRLYLTATPYRSDLRRVLPPDTKYYTKRLVELMLSNFAPRELESSHIESATLGELAERTAASWHKDGRPPIHIRLVMGKDQRAPINALKAAFQQIGAEVVCTYGEDGGEALTNANTVVEAWKRGEIGYEHIPKVYLSIGRMNEGVDISNICCTYFWGIPGSMRLVEQIIGRAARNRRDPDLGKLGYPKQWIKKSKVVFCVGAIGKKNFNRMLLKVYCFLGALENVRYLSRLLPPKDQYPATSLVTRRVVKALTGVQSESDDVAASCIAHFRGHWANVAPLSLINPETHPKTFAPAMVHYYRRSHEAYGDTFAIPEHIDDKSLEKAIVRGLYRERAALLSPYGKLQSKLLEAAEVGSIGEAKLYEILDNMLPEFLALYRGKTHRVGSHNITDLATKVRQALQAVDATKPKNLDAVLSRVRRYRDAHGQWPKPKDYDPHYGDTWTFRQYADQVCVELDWVVSTQMAKATLQKDLAFIVRSVKRAWDRHDPTTIPMTRRRLTIERISLNHPVGFYFPGAVMALALFGAEAVETLTRIHGAEPNPQLAAFRGFQRLCTKNHGFLVRLQSLPVRDALRRLYPELGL